MKKQLLFLMAFVIMAFGINAQTVLDLPITSYSDDVEYFDASGDSDFWSSDIEMMYENGSFHYADALRFTGVTIPGDKVVTKAYIQFTCKETDTYPVSILIKADNALDSQGFSDTEDILARSLTEAVVWNPAGWDVIDQAGENERTSDLSGLLNSLIQEYGGFDDNAVSFILTTNVDSLDGVRNAWSRDGDQDKVAVLHIEYEDGNGGYPQTVNTPFEPQTGLFSTTFDVTPLGTSLDAVVGLSDTEITGWGSDMKAIFLFTDNGKIKVYNGAARGYEQLYNMSYEAGKTYHITMTVDVPNQKYSATIAPDGDDTLIMAYNFNFRAPASELNSWFVHSDSTNGTRLLVDNFTIEDDVIDIHFAQTVNSPFTPQTGVFSTTFDVKPLGTSLDAVVGLSNTEVTGWGPDMKAIFLFTDDGKIKVYNGAARGYEQFYNMSYEAGQVFHITMTVDIPNQKYSATIAPDGGDTLIMAYDFNFRAPASELNSWFVHSDATDGTLLLVENFTIEDDVIDIHFAQTVNSPFTPQTGLFSATFDVKPLGSTLDAVVGLSNTTVTGWGADMKAIILFTDDGKIKVYNGAERGYEQLYDMSYASGMVFHVTITADVPNQKYSATIASENSDGITMAYHFGFRAEAGELNSWFVHSDATDGTKLLVDGFSIEDNVIDILNNSVLASVIDSSRVIVDNAVVGSGDDEYSQEKVDAANIAIAAAEEALSVATTQDEIDQATADLRAAMNLFVTNGHDSIEDVLGADFRMYPNPVRDVLILENISKVNSISIYNTSGMLVKSINSSYSRLSIDLSTLSSGVYIIKFNTNDNGFAAMRLLKQ